MRLCLVLVIQSSDNGSKVGAVERGCDGPLWGLIVLFLTASYRTIDADRELASHWNRAWQRTGPVCWPHQPQRKFRPGGSQDSSGVATGSLRAIFDLARAPGLTLARACSDTMRG